MSCPIGNGGAHGARFLSMAESLSNYTDKVRETCSAKVSAKITGIVSVSYTHLTLTTRS